MTKLLVLSLSTKEINDYALLTAKNQAAYCKHNNYDYIRHIGSLDKDRPPSWSKIILLKRYMGLKYDWLIWVDADIAFTNFDIKLHRFIDNTKFLVINAAKLSKFQAGIFLLRNNNLANNFLTTVYTKTAYIMHPWWEQAAMLEVAEYPKFKDGIKIIPVGDMVPTFETMPNRESLLFHAASRGKKEKSKLLLEANDLNV